MVYIKPIIRESKNGIWKYVYCNCGNSEEMMKLKGDYFVCPTCGFKVNKFEIN
jgi:predicted RNA-binding Zn-ribbon protein involved in translation (DUF1610 family)